MENTNPKVDEIEAQHEMLAAEFRAVWLRARLGRRELTADEMEGVIVDAAQAFAAEISLESTEGLTRTEFLQDMAHAYTMALEEAMPEEPEEDLEPGEVRPIRPVKTSSLEELIADPLGPKPTEAPTK